MKENNPIRMRDIAKECGVSVATVSRVLNGLPGVGPSVQQKVRTVLDRLQYDPLRNIPALRRIKTRTIRVVTPFYGSSRFMADYFFIKALNGVKGKVMELGYEMILSSEAELETLLDPADSSGLLQAAGIILICPGQDYEREISKLQEMKMPVTLINRVTSHKNVISVYENRINGMRKAVSHLQGLGYRDIVFIGPRGTYMRELETAETVFGEVGLPVDDSHLVHCDRADPRERITELLAGYRTAGTMPDALIFYEDGKALYAMKYLARHGYRVPEDIAIIGYDNIELCTMYYPELTSIDCPVDKMAALGTELLIRQAESGERKGESVQMENELVIRDSCGWRLRTENI